MEIKIDKKEENYDSDNVHFIVDGEEKGFGFLPRGEKIIALIRCPICDRENYVFNVLSGKCTWCEFNTKGL